MASSNVKDNEDEQKKLFPLSTGTYLEQLHNLWTKKALCDAVVVVEGRKFDVHRVVLAAASRYFERIFSTEAWIECRTRSVELDGISPLSLEIILKSVYTQELELSPEIVQGVLEAAHRLEFSEVYKCCETYIEDIVAPPNCLDYIKAGEMYNMSKVLRTAEKCLLENFSVVSVQDKFVDMSCDALKNYIKSSALQCESELDVFRAVLRWLNHEDSRKEQAATLMAHVRFGLMGSSNLLGEVWKERVMTSTATCQELLRKAIEFCSKPNEQPFVTEEWCTHRNTRLWLLVIGGQWDHTRCMTPPVVVPFDDPRREIWSIDDQLRPFSNTYQEGGAHVMLGHYLFVTGGVHTYPASSNDIISEAHSTSNRKDMVSNAVWRYNSVQFACEQMTNMMVARTYHTAFLHRDTIFVVGGTNDAKKSLSSTEIYTIKDNSWALGPYLPCGLLQLAGCSYRDSAYISGGMLHRKQKNTSSKKLYKYDTVLKEWIEKAPMLHERCEHVMVGTEHGLFVVGGMQIYKNKDDPYDTSVVHIHHPECYDRSANQWTQLKIEIKSCKPSVVVQNDKIYILGGVHYDDNSDRTARRLASIKCLNTQNQVLEKTTAKLPFHIEDAIMAVMPLPYYDHQHDRENESGDEDEYEDVGGNDDIESYSTSDHTNDGYGSADGSLNSSENNFNSDESDDDDDLDQDDVSTD